MHAASTAKRSEVLSHTQLMQQYPHPRTLMSGISKGGPQQGQAVGHALGVLMMHCMGEHFVAPQVDTLVLEIQASPAYRERKDELGSTWQEHAQQQASSSSAPLVLPAWSRAFKSAPAAMSRFSASTSPCAAARQTARRHLSRRRGELPPFPRREPHYPQRLLRQGPPTPADAAAAGGARSVLDGTAAGPRVVKEIAQKSGKTRRE